MKNKFILNRRGDEKLFFLFLMGVVFVLAFVLVSAIISFLKLDVDIRGSQANLVANKISFCIEKNSEILNLGEEDILEEFSKCGVASNFFESRDDFCLVIYDSDKVIYRSCSNVFETNCRVLLESGIFSERKSASCYETLEFFLNEDFQKVKVLVGIFPKGGRL